MKESGIGREGLKIRASKTTSRSNTLHGRHRPLKMPEPPLVLPLVESFDGTLGRRIISIHRWAVDQGLRGAPAEMLFR